MTLFPEPCSRWLDMKFPDRVVVVDHVDRGVVYAVAEKIDGGTCCAGRYVRMPLLPFSRRYRQVVT